MALVSGTALPLRVAQGTQAARGWLSNFAHYADTQWLLGGSSNPTGWRQQHQLVTRPSLAQSVVPQHILQELSAIDSSLAATSRLDGRRRQPLSAASLPAPFAASGLPAHELEPGLPALTAHVRPGAGRIFAKWLRKAGRSPVRVYSLPGEQELLLHVAESDLGKMVRTYGRNGCLARAFRLDVVAPPEGSELLQPQLQPPTQQQQQQQQEQGDGSIVAAGGPGSAGSAAAAAAGSAVQAASELPTTTAAGERVLGSLRVKPVQVYVNAATQRLEGVDLLYCPVDRIVLVDVPVRLINDDASPGVRKGGWMYVMKRVVRYKALGGAIPPYIEVNVRHMELETDLLVRDLPIPPGTKIYEKDFNAVVVRCTTDVGKD